jgi:hypothetical protein
MYGVNMAMNWPYFEVSYILMWRNIFFGLHSCWLLLWYTFVLILKLIVFT